MNIISIENAISLYEAKRIMHDADPVDSPRRTVRAAANAISGLEDVPTAVAALAAVGVQVDGVMTFLKREFSKAVQAHLDSTARERQYDGILSLCSYAGSEDATFQAEGQAGVAWRDAVWTACAGVLADVEAESRAVPSVADLITELPTIGW